MLLLVSTVMKRKLVIFLIGLKTVSLSAVATLPLLLVAVNIMYMIQRQVKVARVANPVRARNIPSIHQVPLSKRRLRVEMDTPRLRCSITLLHL